MRNYLELLQDVLDNGEKRMDRTGTGTLAVFGRTLRFNLQEGFPAVTTKRVYMKAVWHELLWFLQGEEHIKYLKDNNIRIWNEWADEDGNVGPVYGKQWRRWTDYRDIASLAVQQDDVTIEFTTIDQLAIITKELITKPYSRRHLVSAWNVADLPHMKLPPCHYAFQFFVRDKCLDCMVQMRSVDCFLGLPFDIASYATLTHMIACVTDYQPGELIFCLGDTHIYLNHLEQVKLQLTREPRPLPTLRLKHKHYNIDDFVFDDFELVGYDPHPTIKGDISV